MSHKICGQFLMLALLLAAMLSSPTGAQAGGVCGGSYVVDAGDTLSSIAAKCGTTASAIAAVNPGVTEPLRAGQTLNLAVGSSGGSGTVSSSIVSSDPGYSVISAASAPAAVPQQPAVSYSAAPASGVRTHVVQYGDTFSAIASRYGLSVKQLWAANPQVWNINYIYAGQTLNIPIHASYQPPAYRAATPEPLSYGYVPAGTPYGEVRLVNKSSTPNIYVSLQGKTKDGVSVIYEYPVGSFLIVKVPAGSYKYVAWANQQKFVGYILVGRDSEPTVTFYNNRSAEE